MRRFSGLALVVASLAFPSVALVASSGSVTAQAPPAVGQIDIAGPPGSVGFGASTLVLSNGNYVVTDPDWSNGAVESVGAVYLYDGATNEVISTLTGSSANDSVGGLVVEVGDSNVVVVSPQWDLPADDDVGAITWVDGEVGLDGVVSEVNSLHGTRDRDRVGEGPVSRFDPGPFPAVSVLTNGNYVVRSPFWNDNFGAATWRNGNSPGVTGPLSTDNSLTGTHRTDTDNPRISAGEVTALSNGNYVVRSLDFGETSTLTIGAVTWGDGASGVTGVVSADNSVYGTTPNDAIGSAGVTALTNGNYVVSSPQWDGGPTENVGAVTWLDGSRAVVGPVTTENSLHGTTPEDAIGLGGAVALTNGNYAVASPFWGNGTIFDQVGAVTWGNREGGTTGPVTTVNSLYGTTQYDSVGSGGITPLTNGNYVAVSSEWNNGGDDGAVSWAEGTAPTAGAVSTANSLFRSSTDDGFGGTVIALANGNYVYANQSWDDGATTDVGVVTWGDGARGSTGLIGAGNSLYGTTTDDGVGTDVVALANGNYAVASPRWDDGTTPDVGAATWGNGSVGTVGPVSTGNSLHGTNPDDQVGLGGRFFVIGTEVLGVQEIIPLTDGDYVVSSPGWDNGAIRDAGAVTRATGSSPTVGPVTTENSLHGSDESDKVGFDGIVALAGGKYAVTSNRAPFLGSPDQNGAGTFGGADGVTGPITSSNSVITDPPAALGRSSSRFTTGGALVFPSENEVVLLVPSEQEPPDPDDTGLVMIDPARLLDTRRQGSTLDGVSAGDGRVRRDEVIEVQVAGRGGVPANAESAVLNLTSTGSSRRGYATIFACTDEVPLVSTVNFERDDSVANASIVKLSDTGTVCVFTSRRSHFVIDASGYALAGSSVTTSDPTRLLDTRRQGATVDGEFLGLGRLDAGETLEVQITGRGVVPDGSSAALMNVTAAGAEGLGFVTVYPCGDGLPLASLLNPAGRRPTSNATIVKLSESGTVCVYTSVRAHVIIDATGSVASDSVLETLEPARLLDTRPGAQTIDGRFAGVGAVQGGTTIEVPVAGRGGVPVDARTAVINLTETRGGNLGYTTVYPCTEAVPLASLLNYRNSQPVANSTVVKLSDDGTVCLFTTPTADLILDVTGYQS